jgi:hypothetical protein
MQKILLGCIVLGGLGHNIHAMDDSQKPLTIESKVITLPSAEVLSHRLSTYNLAHFVQKTNIHTQLGDTQRTQEEMLAEVGKSLEHYVLEDDQTVDAFMASWSLLKLASDKTQNLNQHILSIMLQD